MFEDLEPAIDYEAEYKKAVELLKEGRDMILEERQNRHVIERLYHETLTDAKALADFIKKHKDKFSEKELENIEIGDKWDEELKI